MRAASCIAPESVCRVASDAVVRPPRSKSSTAADSWSSVTRSFGRSATGGSMSLLVLFRFFFVFTFFALRRRRRWAERGPRDFESEHPVEQAEGGDRPHERRGRTAIAGLHGIDQR